jgi:hypothetical protein
MDPEEEFVVVMPEGDYEEVAYAIVPLEEGLAILDADEDADDEEEDVP